MGMRAGRWTGGWRWRESERGIKDGVCVELDGVESVGWGERGETLSEEAPLKGRAEHCENRPLHRCRSL